MRELLNRRRSDVTIQNEEREKGIGGVCSAIATRVRAWRAEGAKPGSVAHGAVCAGTITLILPLLTSCSTPPPPRPVSALAVAKPAQSWPRREVLDLALQAYQCGEREGRFERPLLTVIDYSLPSNEPRLWVIDLSRKHVLYHELVAHGEGSGNTVPVAFSNVVGSHQSSLGLFRTDEVYTGRYGYSLRISGLEPGINDKARQRAIVVHGWSGVDRAAAARSGTIGRSLGCPALPEDVAPQIIDRIAGGSAIFVYYPDPEWLRESRYLRCGAQSAQLASGSGHN